MSEAAHKYSLVWSGRGELTAEWPELDEFIEAITSVKLPGEWLRRYDPGDPKRNGGFSVIRRCQKIDAYQHRRILDYLQQIPDTKAFGATRHEAMALRLSHVENILPLLEAWLYDSQHVPMSLSPRRRKLTAASVREIRTLHANGCVEQELAQRYSVSQATINAVVNRDTWKHVKDESMQQRRGPDRMVAENDPQFVRFWDAYPKHVSKKNARAAWLEMAPTQKTVDLMIAALAWQCKQASWLKDGGQYVPYPASWLRAERWTDEAPREAVRADNAGHIPPCRSYAECLKKVLGRS